MNKRIVMVALIAAVLLAGVSYLIGAGINGARDSERAVEPGKIRAVERYPVDIC